ncbi:MAG: amidohydrolase family protein [Candidatus Cybelea sp.]
MDDAGIIDDGALYVSSGVILAVQSRNAPPPHGFDVRAAINVESGGSIFPGLIELHNHRAYNVLSMEIADQRYSNRDQWRPSPANNWLGSPTYNELVATPMLRLKNAVPAAGPAVATYVDTKAVIAGTTTTQGIPIWDQTIKDYTYLPSLIRSVELTGDTRLPIADSRVDDVDSFPYTAQAHPLTALQFLGALTTAPGSYLLHLCEGNNATELTGGIVPAREHFDCLKIRTGLTSYKWALTSRLAGVHCLALNAADFAVLATYKASVVWSPLSNYVLYGATADIRSAKKAGVRIGLGADWSVSGSKNLFGEMKVARAVSDYENIGFTDQDIVAMATINAAKILGWDLYLGSLRAGKLADIIILDGVEGDPYYQLLSSPETSITLVAVGGNALFGSQGLMKQCEASGEGIFVGSDIRVVALRDPTLTVAEAAATIRGVLNSPEPYVPSPGQPGVPTPVGPGVPIAGPAWDLHLPELSGIRSVQGLEGSNIATGDVVSPALKFSSLSPVTHSFPPLEYSWRLDPLAVASDDQYFASLEKQPNLPSELKEGIRLLYGP